MRMTLAAIQQRVREELDQGKRRPAYILLHVEDFKVLYRGVMAANHHWPDKEVATEVGELRPAEIMGMKIFVCDTMRRSEVRFIREVELADLRY